MNYNRAGRIANAILGGWLFLSSLFLPRTIAQQLNTGLVGALALTVALAALYRWPPLRYVNAGLGVWLFVSSWFINTPSSLTFANNMLVGALMFGFAFMATEREPAREVHA